MRASTLSILAFILLALGVIILFSYPRTSKEDGLYRMKVSSTAFGNNERIPQKYTCDGENINPPLNVLGIPQGAKTVVLIMDDPDAPAGTWVHWTVWNIEPQVLEIGEGSAPQGGVEGLTSFGKPGYGGPCPHSGTHRYFFKVYALDVKLDIPPSSDKSVLEKTMTDHVMDKAEIIGLYSRS